MLVYQAYARYVFRLNQTIPNSLELDGIGPVPRAAATVLHWELDLTDAVSFTVPDGFEVRQQTMVSAFMGNQTTDSDSSAVHDAISKAQASGAREFCWFAPNIPDAELRAAIEKFAPGAANEEVLLVVPSVDSGKSGFLFTDKALYFGQTMGIAPRRLPYTDITSMSLDKKFLKIAAPFSIVKWDLTETMLWERSRRKVADVVVPLLQQIISSDKPATVAPPGDSTVKSTTHTAQQASIQIEDIKAIDWPRVLSFQSPIALLGIPFLMPLIYALLAKLGLGDGVFDLDYGEMVLLSVTALVPSMYAFGTELQFSIGRFLVAVAVLAFLTLQVLASGGVRGALPISFGGGVLGIAVAAGLGFGGLAVRNWLAIPTGRRNGLWLGGIALVIVATIVGNFVIEENRRDAIYMAESQAADQYGKDYLPGLLQALINHAGGITSETKYAFTRDDVFIFSLGYEVNFNVSFADRTASRCAEVDFKTTSRRKNFFEKLHDNKASIESALGYELIWEEPYNVNSSEYWFNGVVRACLEVNNENARSDWQRQHEWLAGRLNDLYAVTIEGIPGFADSSWLSHD